MNTMSYRGYTASMTFDTEDKIIVGRVMHIVDIIGFRGESVSEFEANFHHIIDDYIVACAKLGSAPEKPASGKLMLRVAPFVHAAAIKAAASSGKSLNKWAESVLSHASGKFLPRDLATLLASKTAKSLPAAGQKRTAAARTAKRT